MDNDTLIITIAKLAIRVEQLADALIAAKNKISGQAQMIEQLEKEAEEQKDG